MPSNNLVVLRGRVSSEPRLRQLPSGDTIVQLELTTDVDGVATSVPIVDESGRTTAHVGDELLVVGHARRRFFRASGATQSRTEIVAGRIVPITRRAAVERALGTARAALD